MNSHRRRNSLRLWALLDALAFAGALFDPTGALLVARYRDQLQGRAWRP